jgi:hypothetical protein
MGEFSTSLSFLYNILIPDRSLSDMQLNRVNQKQSGLDLFELFLLSGEYSSKLSILKAEKKLNLLLKQNPLAIIHIVLNGNE